MSRLNNINQITGVFKDIKADLTDFTERQVVRYVLTLRNILISDPPIGTPIDTGWATNNWWFYQGIPPGAPSDIVKPTEADISAAQSRQDVDQETILTLKLGQELHIVNNVDYIRYLNNGWSKQTPSGYVERAILSAGIKVRFNTK